ncbi:purine catabolism regulator [Salirhabdus euzebyi]|uniref:Purine catabolism regulator n=1 Tax=Salirhabdus euzebyi TaxID=394506 RepID=A0A841Q510_9BACI|nr:PucR family transcriptional regulator [Salirhabdus euzebyi]MBB6453496.1 purine catabolism regulator [Salirhabdus euzebyi]
MHLTVEDVASLDLLNNGEIAAGKDHLQEAIIEWVSVIETPVENFVRRNEFVLTTGIGCGHDNDLLYEFVREVIQSEASGLAIAIGRYVNELPKSIIDLANEHKFPIIMLPWEVRFAEVIQVIFQALKNEESKIVERNEEIQQELLNIILNNGGLSEIATYIDRTLHKPVIITNKRGYIKGKSKDSSKLEEKWNKYLQSEEYDVFLTSFDTNHYSTFPNTKVISINGKNVLQFTIQTASEIQGYLIVEGLTDKELDTLLGQKTVHLLEHAATAIALCFLKENTILETELKLRDDFVWSLAKEKMNSWDQVLSRAKSLNYNVNLPYVCLIGQPENFSEVFKKNLDHSSYEHWNQNISRRIEDEIYYTGKTLNCQTMTTHQRDQFIIFLEVNFNSVNETVFSFFDYLNKRLKQLLPELILSWGISKTAGLRCFYDSYQEAQKALEIGRRQKGPGYQHMYSDTRIDRALMSLEQNKELKNITDQTIGALLQYDRERGIDLVNTFISYSRNRGNVSQTARELNLHRQSLMYRLRKIESLTDCSLEDPDEIFLIDLSIRLWTVGNLES